MSIKDIEADLYTHTYEYMNPSGGLASLTHVPRSGGCTLPNVCECTYAPFNTMMFPH